jgi:hypothetical protein
MLAASILSVFNELHTMSSMRAIGMLCIWTLATYVRADSIQLYLEQIKPVFKERCYACHGALKQKAGLRLDTANLILNGSNDGRIIDFEIHSESSLLNRLRHSESDERMPPEGKPVTEETIRAIQAWIEAGAPVPEREIPEDDPLNHWAYIPPIKPKLIDAANHPIDALLADAHEQHNLKPQPAAEPRILMRRLHLDLIGLPPSQDEIEPFLKNPNETQYGKIVDALLTSPQHAERWGRHWMDVWRYSDWFGLGAQLRYSQKHIWHWRDWILDSLNEDKGYDQMIWEMLAADELYPLDQDRLRATGFLARNYFLFNRTTWLDKTIEHTSKAFLGLTMQCSKCHDHKYDPISAKDYYQFRAILEPHQIRTDTLPGESNLEKGGLPRAFDMHLDARTYIHVRGNEKEPDTSEQIHPGPPAFLGNIPFKVTSIALPPEAYRPETQTHVRDTLLQEAIAKIQTLEVTLKSLSSETAPCESIDSAIIEIELEWHAAKLRPAMIRSNFEATRQKAVQPDAENLNALIQRAATAEYEYVLAQLDWEISISKRALNEAPDDKKEALKKKLDQYGADRSKQVQTHTENPLHYKPIRASIKALESPAETEKQRLKSYPPMSTGRRTALAKWITHPDNPLTARVAVNHIWMRHFGMPLVDPVTDFGRQTKAPKLQKILDFLAITLMENNWRMKSIHRLIVTSQAYQRSSSILNAQTSNRTQDPENSLLWRQNAVRMESQVLRDSLLQLSKQLDTQIGGPTIDPKGAKSQQRRSLYFTHSRDDQHLFLNLFDDASILACYRRSESIIPQQALALANSALSMDAASQITKTLQELGSQQGGLSNASFVVSAFEHILGWTPNSEEKEICLKNLEQWEKESRPNTVSNALSPRDSLIHALINHNDFITIR